MMKQKTVSPKELATYIYNNIQPGETYSFYQRDEQDDRLYYPHYIMLVKLADSELLVANFHGGGNPFVFERREKAFPSFCVQFEEYLRNLGMGENLAMDIAPTVSCSPAELAPYGPSVPVEKDLSGSSKSLGSYLSLSAYQFAKYLISKAVPGTRYEFAAEDSTGNRHKFCVAAIKHGVTTMYLFYCYNKAYNFWFDVTPGIFDCTDHISAHSRLGLCLMNYLAQYDTETLFVTEALDLEINENNIKDKKASMNRAAFMEHLRENYQLSAEAQRFISNIMAYAEEMADKDDAKEFLYTMFDGTIGISEAELDMLQL